MTMLDYETDPVQQFIDAMVENGITPPKIIERDGQFHRFSTNGKLTGRAGWYIYRDGDVVTGSFGDDRTGIKVKRWVADIGRPLSESERTAFEEQQRAAKVKRDTETAAAHAKAKSKAEGILKQTVPERGSHPYLVKKGVKPYGIGRWKDLLVIPMTDESQQVQSLQLISADGQKKFLSGGKMRGCYHALGDLQKAEVILIAEGFATAATIRETTGLPVVVAFNAGNLDSVSKTIRAKHPEAMLILCADDDYKTTGNPGLSKAYDAAEVVNGKVFVPEFGENRPEGATDFNDMAAHLGKEHVTRYFQRLLTQEEEPEPEPAEEEGPEIDYAAILSKPANSNRQETHIEPVLPPQPRQIQEPPPAPQPVAKPKVHFSEEELRTIKQIWKDVPHVAAIHSEDGYRLVTDAKRRIIVSKTRIQLPKKARHRDDSYYVAACEQARQLWGGQMEIRGDSDHCAKAWAYAQVYGVQVVNYSPTDKELVQAQKIMDRLRKTMEPTIQRPRQIPTTGRTQPKPRV